MVECEIVFAGDKYTIDLSQYPQAHINRGDRNTADIVRSAGTTRLTELSCHCAIVPPQPSLLLTAFNFRFSSRSSSTFSSPLVIPLNHT